MGWDKGKLSIFTRARTVSLVAWEASSWALICTRPGAKSWPDIILCFNLYTCPKCSRTEWQEKGSGFRVKIITSCTKFIPRGKWGLICGLNFHSGRFLLLPDQLFRCSLCVWKVFWELLVQAFGGTWEELGRTLDLGVRMLQSVIKVNFQALGRETYIFSGIS